MGAESYEVLVINPKSGRQTKRKWTATDLINSVKWLKRMNARGADILIKPLGGPELRLAAALDADGIAKLRDRGLAPAIVVETRPGRFEAWVKLSGQPLPQALRADVLMGLPRGLGEEGQHGRLAGFTNQQSAPNRAGRQPSSLVHEATGTVAKFAEHYLIDIKRKSVEKAAERQRLMGSARARPVRRGRLR